MFKHCVRGFVVTDSFSFHVIIIAVLTFSLFPFKKYFVINSSSRNNLSMYAMPGTYTVEDENWDWVPETP